MTDKPTSCGCAQRLNGRADGDVHFEGCSKFNQLPRTSVLTEAEGLVHGARNVSYGHPLDDFTRTAGMASAMLAHKLKAPLTPEDVGMFMCLIKLSRQVNAPKRDNMVDLAGYAETVQWCIDEREVRNA